MAINKPPGDGQIKGQVTGRSQTYNPKTDRYVKRDTDSGKFMDQKSERDSPFKGVRKEK